MDGIIRDFGFLKLAKGYFKVKTTGKAGGLT